MDVCPGTSYSQKHWRPAGWLLAVLCILWKCTTAAENLCRPAGLSKLARRKNRPSLDRGLAPVRGAQIPQHGLNQQKGFFIMHTQFNVSQTEYIHPERDRKSRLFLAILERARADGSISGIEPILDYYLPNQTESATCDQDTYLTDYRFDIAPQMTFGSSEGIYVDVYLIGKFDDSGTSQTSIGVFKTLRTDLEACRLMGELCGVLMYHGSCYVNKDIHRYTPQTELQAEYQRKLDTARRKQEDQQ